jgi:hypothetical protein
VKTPEGYEKDEICKYLTRQKPVIWYFRPYMAGFGGSGVPDIVGCAYPGRLFAIEVKRDGKSPTELQARRMKEIETAGGKTFWGTAAKVIPEFRAWVA